MEIRKGDKYVEYKELNDILLAYYPELGDEIKEERDCWLPEEPGGHILYGNVFNPYAVKILESGEKEETDRLFVFLKYLLNTNDFYAQNVLCATVLEQLIGSMWSRKLKNRDQLLRDLIKIYDEAAGNNTYPLIPDVEKYRDIK